MQYLQTFEAIKCGHFQPFRRENYFCFECLQILHAEYEYTVCLWIVLIFEYMRCTLFLWKSVGYNLRKVQLPNLESSDFNVKNCALFQKNIVTLLLDFLLFFKSEQHIDKRGYPESIFSSFSTKTYGVVLKRIRSICQNYTPFQIWHFVWTSILNGQAYSLGHSVLQTHF